MSEPLICVIDDDEATRSALVELMRAKGLGASAYASAEDFLASRDYERAQCIISDINMPGLSGLELKAALDAEHSKAPVIMITARCEERLHRQALDSGAFCFLRKPFATGALFECIERALKVPPVP